jgi:hypothetical protein
MESRDVAVRSGSEGRRDKSSSLIELPMVFRNAL